MGPQKHHCQSRVSEVNDSWRNGGYPKSVHAQRGDKGVLSTLPQLKRAAMVLAWVVASTCASSERVVAQTPEICSLSKPDDRLSPEGYQDGLNHSYLQLPASEYGLRKGDQPFQQHALAPVAVPLCLDRYAVVWSAGRPGGGDYADVMGLIVDKNLQPLSEPFDVSRGNSEYEPLITRLDAAHFLVLWQAIRGESGKERREPFARVFDYKGEATTKEFPISQTGQYLNDAHARLLSNGRIVFAWYRFKVGVFFRLFDQSGRALTDETLVAPFSSLHGEPISTTTAVAADGFAIFIRDSDFFNAKPPFSSAREYRSSGVPLGPLVVGDSVQQQPGHQQALEVIAMAAASSLEFDIRQVKRRTTGDPWYGRLCRPEGAASLSNAIGVVKYSRNNRIRAVAVAYCRTWESTCGLYEYRKDEHRACSDATN